MSMGRHRCDAMPYDADISWSMYFKPTLTVGTDEGDTPFHFDKRVDYCPWCGEYLLTEYAGWRMRQKEPNEYMF